MDPSTGFKHVANLYTITKAKSEEVTHGLFFSGTKTTLYFVLIGCDGGQDHNLQYVVKHIGE